MKKKIEEKIEIPEGIKCEVKDNLVECRHGDGALYREINIPYINVKKEDNTLILSSLGGNKNQYKIIKSYIVHLKNLFGGIKNPYVYFLEACNVHFPMTLKVENNKLIINNFLGEKISRSAEILSGVKVEVKGQKITVSSHDKESAGQTAANIEKATKVRNRDRRIFQDGIYIIEKPGGKR